MIFINHSAIDYHTLEDISSTGKPIDWNGKKFDSIIISDSMVRSGLKKRALNISNCGTYLTFMETISNRKKLFEANFCRDRMCPMCTWRKSLKQFGQTSKLMNHIKDREKVRYVFLTLTVKNCDSTGLSESLSSLINGFRLLLDRKLVKKVVLGCCRHIEVTFNANSKSSSFKTFHPHIHVILMVKPSYFTQNYIKQSEWQTMWAQSVKVDYEPVVHIETVKKSEQEKAVAELSKYPIKMQNLLSISDSMSDIFDYAVETLALNMVGVRLIEYYGAMRRYRRELKLEDVETGDLVSTDIDELNEELTGVILRYQWRNGLYVQVEDFV